MDVVSEELCEVKLEPLEPGDLVIDESQSQDDGFTRRTWHSPCSSPSNGPTRGDKYALGSSHYQNNTILDLSLKRNTKVPAPKRSLLHTVLLQETEKMKPHGHSEGMDFKVKMRLASKRVPKMEDSISRKKRQNTDEHMKVLEEQAFRTNLLSSNEAQEPANFRIRLQDKSSKATGRQNCNKKRCVQLTKKPFTCKRCLKAYIYLPSLLKHMKTHDTAHVCSQCNRQFTTVFKLKKHTINAHVIDSVKT